MAPASNKLLIETCAAIKNVMESSWQKLPISQRFIEPIPTSVTCAMHRQGFTQVTNKSYVSAFDAVIAALEESDNPVWLSGCAGGGKTVSMKWMTAQFAQRFIDGRSKWLPVYVDLGQVGHELVGGNLDEIIQCQLEKKKPINYVPFRGKGSRCLFFLDGLDLLKGDYSERRMLDEALNAKCGRFVFAGRAETAITEALNEWSCSARIMLGELDEDHRNQWFVSNATKAALDKYYLILSGNPMAEQLLRVPLLFAMTASVCIDAEGKSGIDSNQFPGRTGIFAGFVQYAILRAIKQGRIASKLKIDIQEVSMAIGERCLQAARLGHLDRLPKSMLPKSSKLKTNGHHWPQIESIFEKAGVIEETPSSYKFIHQQFAEYLAGKFMANQWSKWSKKPDFNKRLADDLAYRERDPIAGHAIATLGEQVAGVGILERVFFFVGDLQKGDACQLFADSGSKVVIPLIGSVMEDKRANEFDRISAIHVLSRIPQDSAIGVLCKFISRYRNYSRSLIYSAIKALGRCVPNSAHDALRQIVEDSANPSWMRVGACAQGALLPIPELKVIVADAMSIVGLESEIKKDAILLSVNWREPDANLIREYLIVEQKGISQQVGLAEQVTKRLSHPQGKFSKPTPIDAVLQIIQENAGQAILLSRSDNAEGELTSRDI